MKNGYFVIIQNARINKFYQLQNPNILKGKFYSIFNKISRALFIMSCWN